METQTATHRISSGSREKDILDEDALQCEIREFQAMGRPLERSEKELLARKCGGV
jgi:hypothetical protein